MIADKKVSLVYLVQTCPYNISALNTNGKSFQSYNVNLLWTRNYFGTSRFEATNLDYIATLDYKNTTSKYYDMRTATFELTLTRKYFKILVECAGPVGCLTMLAGVSLFTRWQSFTQFLFLFSPLQVSFVIPPEVIPGRLSLLLTLFLMTINTLNSVSRSSPSGDLSPNSLIIWICICKIFLMVALTEYAWIVAFHVNENLSWKGIRMHRCSSKNKKKTKQTRVANAAVSMDAFFAIAYPSVFMVTAAIFWSLA